MRTLVWRLVEAGQVVSATRIDTVAEALAKLVGGPPYRLSGEHAAALAALAVADPANRVAWSALGDAVKKNGPIVVEDRP